MPSLFDPLDLAPGLRLPNRILMAPLTRGRADRDGVPTALMGDYYEQRASAGLIITEATGISREGLGWPYAPGLWTIEQRDGWKPIVERVHRNGGRIVAQLWHMGRMVHSAVTGREPLSASPIAPPGEAHSYEGKRPFETPRAATAEDIVRVLDDYRRAAGHAIEAGFDGVQIHAANGYLIDQFLRASSNRRDDEYGGSVDNRLRFLTQVVEAVQSVAGIDRTAIRLSPNGAVNGCDDPDHVGLFTAVAARLQQLAMPWIELRQPGTHSSFRPTDQEPVSPHMRAVFAGPIVLNSDYKPATAEAAVRSGEADAITFGRPFIANPDLVERIRRGAPLNRWDTDTFYSQGRAGYTDYPTLEEQAAA